MISAMIVCNDTTLGAAVDNYFSMRDSFRLVERTDKGSVAIQAILGLTPDIVICQDLDDLTGLALLNATYPYAPNTFFLMCDVQKNYETLLHLLRAGVGNVLPSGWTEDDLWTALDQFQVNFAAKRQAFKKAHTEQLRRVLDKKFFEDTIVTCSGNAILNDPATVDYEYGISFVDGWFQPMYILIDPRPKENLQPDSFFPMLQVEELARQYFGKYSDTLVCYVMDHGLTLILNTHRQIEDCRKLCRMFLSLCSQKLAWYRGQNTISIGIGLAAMDPQQIPRLVETAKFAGWMRLSEGKGRVFQYVDYENTCRGKHDYLSREARDALRRSVADMDEAFMIDTIRDTLQQTDNAGSYIATALSINDVLIDAFNRQGKPAVVENSKYLRLARNMPPMIENLDSLGEIQQAMVQWARNCMCQMLAHSGEKKDAAIYTAKQYISAHYTKPLRLEEVAEHVHLTTSYFCMKFRQETGTTFVAYLTELRLARAKDLLRHSNKKIHEIAVTVGFADSRHFSRTFFRSCGMHPTDYRAQFHGMDVS